MLLVQKGATQPALIPTQMATTVFSSSSPSTTTPRATFTQPAAGLAPKPTYQSASVVLFVIIGLSLGLAGIGTRLKVKTPS